MVIIETGRALMIIVETGRAPMITITIGCLVEFDFLLDVELAYDCLCVLEWFSYMLYLILDTMLVSDGFDKLKCGFWFWRK